MTGAWTDQCRGRWRSAFLACLLAACSADEPPTAAEPAIAAKPPIILISLDTLRADYLGAYGYRAHRTSPTLDKFADRSFVFETSMVSEPFTLTSHMGLLTGLAPQHHRVVDDARLRDGVRTLAEHLRAYGYATRAHADGGFLRPRWGFGRGFDLYKGNMRRGASRIFSEPRNWIRNHRGEPFFLFLHTYDAHNYGHGPLYTSRRPFKGRWSARHRTPRTPRVVDMTLPQIIATDEDIDYVRATYAESVRQLDADLGDFFRFLREVDVWNDALIILWSDHGEGLFDHGSFSHDELYEHTLRSVLMIKLPGGGRSERVRDVVREVDLLPTILELVGAPPAESIDGISFAGLLRDGASEERLAFSKLTRSGKRQFSVRSRTHRYIWNETSDTAMFFDHVVDPGESSNLSPSNTPHEAELRDALLAWVASYDAAFAQTDEPETAMPLDGETQEALRALGYID